MASTSTPPPATERVRTPPTPLHGPKYDSWEPFSPRRSSRISSRYGKNSSLDRGSPASKRQASPDRASGTSKKPPVRRTNSQTFSPPSSPLEPSSPARKTSTPKNRRVMERDRMNRQYGNAATSSDEALDDNATLRPPKQSLQNGRFVAGSLPTPVKTPRKRNLHDEAQVKSTARVLFPSRPQNADDVMPSPKKARRANKYSAQTLESLAEEPGNGMNSEKIQIYTDSHERVPEPDEDEDESNPFVVRKGAKPRAKSQDGASKSKKKDTKYGMTKQVDEAVEHDKGVVYVFRGKKFFRKFDDEEEDDEAVGEAMGGLQEEEIRRRAGPAARKRFTRSSLKPRLLFPPEEEEEADMIDVDEEAITDIEHDHLSAAETKGKIKTPVKPHFRPATPPTTVRKNKTSEPSFTETVAGDTDPDAETSTSPSRRKKPGPFDNWQRTKPGVSPRSASAKRAGEPMNRTQSTTEKRQRSGSFHGVL